MSEKIFSLLVNDKEVTVNSKETRLVLESVLTVKDMTSDTLQIALSQKDDKGREYKTFYADLLTTGKNPDDVFSVTITKGESVVTGKATRQVIASRLLIASNIEKYNVEIERIVPETKGEKKTKVVVTPDDI